MYDRYLLYAISLEVGFVFNVAAFLSYVFVTTFTPGPNNIMSMTNARQYGFRKTFSFVLGVSAGFAVIMLLSGYFNLLLYGLIPKIRPVMGIAAAVYMLYLAYAILKSSTNKKEQSKTYSNSFLTGLLLQFLNAKLILYGITVISSFITPYYRSNTSIVLFALFLGFIGFLSNVCWASFGALMQKFLVRYRKPFDIVMAGLLVYCAVSVSGIIG